VPANSGPASFIKPLLNIQDSESHRRLKEKPTLDPTLVSQPKETLPVYLFHKLNRSLGRGSLVPELELSNNLAESAMRPIALGRRNWIDIGSDEARSRVATISR
jgi:hypothetical protein